ncbi:EAL domain-containing protein, partial [Bowmanella dokdonensis]|nr:EAL domain-containing protein [Bowmanella dokdonensis]
GIETAEQLQYLREKGVDSLQGYYFARPMPLAELLKYLPDKQQSNKGLF